MGGKLSKKEKKRIKKYRKWKEEKELSVDEIVEKRAKELLEKGEAEEKGIGNVASRISTELHKAGIEEPTSRVKQKIAKMPLKYSEKVRKPHQPYLQIGLTGSKEEFKISKDQKKVLKWLQRNKTENKSKKQLEKELRENLNVKEKRIKDFLDKLEEKNYKKLQ